MMFNLPEYIIYFDKAWLSAGSMFVGLFLFSAFTSAQINHLWDTILYSGGNHGEIIELDSSYVTMTRGINTTTLQVWQLDNSGQLIDSSSIDFGAVIQNCGNCLISSNQKNLYYAHNLFYSTDSGVVQFIKFNALLDTLQTRIYRYNDTLSTDIGALKLIDNQLYFTGYVYLAPNRYQLLLGCLDTNFNVIWEKQFLRNFATGGFWGYDLERTSDGGILVSGINTNFPLGTFRKGLLFKTDSIGNEEWRNTLDYPSGRLGGQLYIKPRSDGKMIYAGKQEFASGLQKVRFGVITDSGRVELDTLIGMPVNIFGAASLTQTLDGNYVMAGSTLHNFSQGMAFKFNENGASLWQRYYREGEPGERSEIYTVRPTLDSGVIFAGTYYDNLNNPSQKVIYHWVKKVDKHGCQVPNCHNMDWTYSTKPEDQILIYPNPTSDIVHVEAIKIAPPVIKAYTIAGQLLAVNYGEWSIEIPDMYHGLLIIEVNWENHQARSVIVKN